MTSILDIDEILFIVVIIALIFFSLVILNCINKKESKMKNEDKAHRDMLDLERITKNIETDYKPLNIELTSYEQEQENNAIISYEELLSNKNNSHLNYDENYKGNEEISVKKVDLNEGSTVMPLKSSEFEVTLMSYEKEEAFLKALKQLQSDLVR